MSERRTRLCLLSEFPGKNYYSLKIIKGNPEPRQNTRGSCADLHVDCAVGRLTLKFDDYRSLEFSISLKSDFTSFSETTLVSALTYWFLEGA